MHQAPMLASYLEAPTNYTTPKQIRLDSPAGMMEFRHTGRGTVAFEHLRTGRKFQLSAKHHIAVANAIKSTIQQPQTTPSTTTKPFKMLVSPHAVHPICLFFDANIDFSLKLSEARIIADFLSDGLLRDLHFYSAKYTGHIILFSTGECRFENMDNHYNIELSKSETHDLLIELRTSICNFNSTPSNAAIKKPLSLKPPVWSTSQSNSQSVHNGSVEVVFDDNGEHPLHVMIMIDNYQTYLHIRSGEIDDFIRCLSTRDSSAMRLVTTCGDYDVYWCSLDQLLIQETGMGNTISLIYYSALELAELIKSNMPGTHETQDLDIDPLAGARKRTDNNLNRVFG